MKTKRQTYTISIRDKDGKHELVVSYKATDAIEAVQLAHLHFSVKYGDCPTEARIMDVK